MDKCKTLTQESPLMGGFVVSTVFVLVCVFVFFRTLYREHGHACPWESACTTRLCEGVVTGVPMC